MKSILVGYASLLSLGVLGAAGEWLVVHVGWYVLVVPAVVMLTCLAWVLGSALRDIWRYRAS